MKGLDLAKKYFDEFGMPMLNERFSDIKHLLAAGLVGSGSECLGFDDDISHDHDFEPCFCLFIPEEIDDKTAFALERAYAKLPRSFMGYERSPLTPVGKQRHGVMKISDFYLQNAGTVDGELSIDDWFKIPEYALAEAVNGEVFFDQYGMFTSIRNRLSTMPRDVFLKKLAGDLITMSQSGQYNFYRCCSRGEHGAAQLSIYEFARSAMHSVFLFNGKYMPYYKWSFRAMRGLERFSELADPLEYMISTENTKENAELKHSMIEDIASLFVLELQDRGLTDGICNDLEKHAYSVNDRISDNDVRNRNIFFAV